MFTKTELENPINTFLLSAFAQKYIKVRLGQWWGITVAVSSKNIGNYRLDTTLRHGHLVQEIIICPTHLILMAVEN